MKLTPYPKRSAAKNHAIADFADHVSSGKAAFFHRYGMDFVMGPRKGSFMWDIDGSKRLFNLHCNGGMNIFCRGRSNVKALDFGFQIDRML